MMNSNTMILKMQTFIRKHEGQKEEHFYTADKRTDNPGFYTQQNHPSGIKEK